MNTTRSRRAGRRRTRAKRRRQLLEIYMRIYSPENFHDIGPAAAHNTADTAASKPGPTIDVGGGSAPADLDAIVHRDFGIAGVTTGANGRLIPH